MASHGGGEAVRWECSTRDVHSVMLVNDPSPSEQLPEEMKL
jgi:hypothetical protein